MELIVILLGGFLYAPVIAAITIAAEMCALVLSGILALVGMIMERRIQGSTLATAQPDKAQPAPAPPPATAAPTETAAEAPIGAGAEVPAVAGTAASRRTPRRWPMIFSVVCLALAVLTLGSLWILDTFYFQGTVRWALQRLDQKTGIEVTFETANGSLLGGQVEMKGVKIRQPGGKRTRCDLTLDRVQVAMSITTLLSSVVIVDQLELQGLRGSFDRLGKRQPPRNRSTTPFEIQKLTIRGLDVQYTEHRQTGRRSYRIAVPEWQSEPLRSRWLPFDVLFRTNCVGTLAGAGFQISCKEVDGGRQTIWQARELPIWYLADQVGGPFLRISGGVADVEIVDEWSLRELARIDSRWKLTMRDFEAEVPPGLSPLQRATYVPWVRVLQKLDGKPLEFHLQFDGRKLTTWQSPDSKSIWTKVGLAMVKRLLKIKRP